MTGPSARKTAERAERAEGEVAEEHPARGDRLARREAERRRAPPPTLAPSTSVSASGRPTSPAPVSEMTKSTKATLECISQVKSGGEDQRQHRVVRQPRQHQRRDLAVAHRRRGGADQAERQQDQAEADQDAAGLRRRAAARPCRASTTPASSSSGITAREVDRQRLHHQRRAEVGAEHQRQRRRQRDQAAGDEAGDQHRRGGGALHRRRRRRTGGGRAQRAAGGAARSRRGSRSPKPLRIAACTICVPQSSRATPPIRFRRMVWPAMRRVALSLRASQRIERVT